MFGVPRNRQWPRHPPPLAEESFSSWFLRLADANGLPASELYAGALPGSYLNRQDLDRTAGPELIRVLSTHTGVDARDIRDRTFARWVGQIFGEDDGRCRLDWLPPIGSEKARRSFGQQYCPACLASDEVPYFRLEWRLRFVALCPVHKCLLADRCPACASPIYVLRVSGNARGWWRWQLQVTLRQFLGALYRHRMRSGAMRSDEDSLHTCGAGGKRLPWKFPTWRPRPGTFLSPVADYR